MALPPDEAAMRLLGLLPPDREILETRLDAQRMLNYYQSVMAEMVALQAPRFIVRADYMKPPEDGLANEPKIAAEKLLRSILPIDLCISLSAIGECEVQGKKHRYKIFKNQKTHCFQGDRTFSCCIELSDSSAPDTDRIVAEFLLITNNEDEYLKTANLTQIAGPRPEGVSGLSFHRDAFAMNVPAFTARIGDTIEVRRPPRYEVRGRELSTQIILMMLLNRIGHHERMQGMRFPILPPGMQFGRDYLNMQHFGVDIDYDDEALTLSADDFYQRYLRAAVEQMVDMLLEPGFVIRGFIELPTPGGVDMGGRVRDPQSGICIRMIRAYDIRNAARPTRIEACVIREPYGT